MIHVTKMKQNLTYEVTGSTCYVDGNGLMQWKEETVIFRKEEKSKNEETGEVGKTAIEHHARIVTYIDEKNRGGTRLVRLLTNDLETEYGEIVDICGGGGGKG